MSFDLSASPNPYRPYVVPIDPSPSYITPSKSSSSPRDIFAEFDIPIEYLENPEFSDLVSNLVNQGLSKYASVLIRQPFEIVKTIMQVQYSGQHGQRTLHPPRRYSSRQGIIETDEDFDDAVLF